MTGNKHSGRIIWITGLSGAGKTTLAIGIVEEFRKKGIPAILIDGDEIRQAVSAIIPSDGVEFSKDFREKLGMTYFDLAALIAAQGYLVVVATISLFHSVQRRNRSLAENYFEVYLETDARVHSSRADKLLAQRVTDKGNIVGIGITPEFPENPDSQIVVDATWSMRKVLDDAMVPIWAWFLGSAT